MEWSSFLFLLPGGGKGKNHFILVDEVGFFNISMLQSLWLEDPSAGPGRKKKDLQDDLANGGGIKYGRVRLVKEERRGEALLARGWWIWWSFTFKEEEEEEEEEGGRGQIVLFKSPVKTRARIFLFSCGHSKPKCFFSFLDQLMFLLLFLFFYGLQSTPLCSRAWLPMSPECRFFFF